MRVDISEPDVSPLAVQGPKAEDVLVSVFGEKIRDIKFFWFIDAEIDGIPLKISRSGYSKQCGFEVYLMDSSRGKDLWNIIREAGAPWNIGPGNPNPAERIESGLLSYGGDTDDETNPFEVRLDKYVDLDLEDEVIGIKALRKIKAEGPARQQLSVVFEDNSPQEGHHRWYDIYGNDKTIGSMTNGIWSPKLKRFIGFGLVSNSHNAGDSITVLKMGSTWPPNYAICLLPRVLRS